MIRRFGTPARHSAWRLGAAVLAATLLVGLSACAPEPPASDGTGNTTTEAPETPATPEPAPEFYPEGSAEENLPYFEHVLREYAAGTGPLEGRTIVDTIVDAGFDRNSMQVTFDRSKTGLVADSIYVSVLIGDSCLLGQLVTEDRSTVAVTEPVVGPEANICLIGETRPIDG